MQARWDEATIGELRSGRSGPELEIAVRLHTARQLAAEADLGAPGMLSASLKCSDEAGRAVLWMTPRDAELASLREIRLEATGSEIDSDAALHAAVPARWVEQIHPTALLALAAQPDAELRLRSVLGPRLGWVGWHDSSFGAARAVADLCEKHPELEAIFVQGRGLLCFGDDARRSFERALDIARRAEEFVLEQLPGGRLLDARPVVAMREAGEVAHVLRGALAAPTGDLDRPWLHVVLDFRSSDEIAHFASAPLTPLLAASMPPSIAHARLCGSAWLFVPSPPYADLAALRDALRGAVETQRRAWIAALERCSAADTAPSGELDAFDPTPRAVLLPGIGLFGVGENRAQAQRAAAAAEHAVRVKARAATLGQYEGIPERGALQLASSRAPRAALCGQVALVAGARACEPAVLRELSSAGAEVLRVDADLELELLDPLDARDALRAATERAGGIDLLVLDVDALGAQASGWLIDQALALLAAQGTGGAVLLVARDADVTELCKDAARRGAPANVRANALALGASEKNLLRMPITPGHVARALAFLGARGAPITGQTLAIDGGG